MSDTIRIQKYVAICGVGSRREAELLIAQGRVLINDAVARFGDTVTPDADHVTVDGTPIQADRLIYILLNKPRDVISSIKDPEQRNTIADCLNDLDTRIFPADRLPKDVQGALLLTNDGNLVLDLNHPDRQLDMTYVASVEGVMSEEVVSRLAHGVSLGRGLPIRARVIILDTALRTSLVRVVLRESRVCRVNRLLAAVGYPAFELRRIAIANLHLDNLEPGEWRRLTDAEIEGFRRALQE